MATVHRLRQALRSVTVLALLAGLAACSSGGSDEAAEDGSGVAGEGAPVEDAARSDADRQVIVTGSLTVVVPDAIVAADSATRIVEAVGGRVDNRTDQAPVDDEPATSWLTVRVPADALTDTLEELSDLGEVRDRSLTRSDVTLEVTDLDARIQALEVSVGRLQALVAQAGSVADLLEAESALTQRQAELDSLRAQRAYLAEQVALSTISLSLLPEATAPAPEPGGFWGGVQRGWAALVSVFNQAVVVLGVLLPWIAVAGVVVAAVVLVGRMRPRKPRPPAPPRQPPGPYPLPAPPSGPGAQPVHTVPPAPGAPPQG